MNITYRGFSIEQERDGSFSVYHPALHYVRGNFRARYLAQDFIDKRLAYQSMRPQDHITIDRTDPLWKSRAESIRKYGAD